MRTINDYEKQALYFAKKYGVKLQILGSEYKPMWGEKQKRWVFKCKLSRSSKSYTFEFGQSIANSGNDPTMYDILTCLTKYDPYSFANFCAEFGYDINSRNSKKHIWLHMKSTQPLKDCLATLWTNFKKYNNLK